MKILKLTYNEIIKLIKKTSFKICVTLLFIFTVLLSILFNYSFDNGEIKLYYDIDLELAKDEIIDKPKSDMDYLLNDINNFKIELINKSISNNEIYSDFKFNLHDEYINKKTTLIIINYIINDKSIDTASINEKYNLDIKSFNNLDDKSLIEIYNNLNKEVTTLEEVMRTNDYTWYLNMKLSILKESDSRDNNALNMIKAYEKLLSLNITDQKDHRITLVEELINLYNQKEEPISKSDFLKTGNPMNYEEYVKITTLKNKKIDDDIKISWYALNNNIDLSINSKNFQKDSIINNSIFISLIIVIAAGGIISNEFQNGTIRLLVTKPNKRIKIFLSKILAITFIAIILSLSSYVISFLINGILFGFSDYFIPDLVVSSSNVIEKSFIFRSFVYILILLIPIIFIGIVAMFLSTITNSTAFSVGLSIFLLVGYQLIILLLSSFNISFIKYTFLPYLDYSQFLNNTYLDNISMYGFYYNFLTANLVIIFWCILLYSISNLIFIKKDIKN